MKTGENENPPSDFYGMPYELRMALLPLIDDATCAEVTKCHIAFCSIWARRLN